MIVSSNIKELSHRTLEWFGSDSFERMEYNLQYNKHLLNVHGWLNPRPLTYKFNKQGFRSDDFTDKPSIMFLGCSHTFGLGLPVELTWAYYISKMLNLKNVNLSFPGTSNDTAFRTALEYIPKINPKIVILLSPASARFDIADSTGNISTLLPVNLNLDSSDDNGIYSAFYKTWISNDANIELNKIKNVLAVKQLCTERKIKFVHRDIESIKCIDLARDLLHMGIRTNKLISRSILKDIGTP